MVNDGTSRNSSSVNKMAEKRYAILVAGGTGTRMGAGMPKQFLPLPNGVPILVQTFQVFAQLPAIEIIVVLPEPYLAEWSGLSITYEMEPHLALAGGPTRTESVAAGMAHVPPEALVAIHDGVRPYVTPALIKACFEVAAKSGAACAAVPSKDSLRQRLADGSSRAVPREQFFLVQTPQTFRASIWQEAYAAAPADALFTDDASLVEAAGHPISLVEGSYANIKITTPEDLG